MTLPTHTRAVVTGAGGGLGRAFCLELARRGASLVVSDIHEDAARATAAMIPSTKTVALRCDVSRREEVQSLARAADEAFGGTDLLINNAGVAVSGEVGAVAPADWDWIVGINLMGPGYGCEAVLPDMKKRGSGHILNVASMAGLVNAPRMGPYNVTKAGVISLTETLYAELKGTGVNVTVLCPSFFKTNILDNMRGSAGDHRVIAERSMHQSPINADDVARIALDASVKDELYVLPHRDARWFWRIKRVTPTGFLDRVPGITRRLVKMMKR